MAEFDVPWTKILIVFFGFLHWFFCSFLDNVEIIKSDSGRKSGGHRTSKIVKSRQSYSIGHLPYYCSFYYLARALLHDVGCELACAIRMRRNNWRIRHYFMIKLIMVKLISSFQWGIQSLLQYLISSLEVLVSQPFSMPETLFGGKTSVYKRR